MDGSHPSLRLCNAAGTEQCHAATQQISDLLTDLDRLHLHRFCRAPSCLRPSACFAGAGSVLVLAQALALNRCFVLPHARDDIMSCQG